MKKIILLLTVAFGFSFSGFSQVNPIQNLHYEQEYVMPYTLFSMQWDPPETPHDNLLGYNIYRENEFYQFQTETYLNDNNGADFPDYQGEGYGVFWAHVTVVYEVEGERVESIYNDSIQTGEPLIDVKLHSKKPIAAYPNPTTGKITVSAENLNSLTVFNMQGKRVEEKSVSSQIDLSGKPAGIYFLRITTTGNKKLLKKIILK